MFTQLLLAMPKCLKILSTFVELTGLSEQHIVQNITRFSKNSFSAALFLQ